MPRGSPVPTGWRDRDGQPPRRTARGGWPPSAVLAALFVLLLSAIGGVPAGARAAAAADPEIAALAEQARAAFRRRMNPPAPYLALPQILEREAAKAARDYALRAFEDALDALAAEADRSQEARDAVAAALRTFVATGKARAADAILAGIAERRTAAGDPRSAAAAVRHGVALVELPAALAPLIRLPGEALPFPPLGDRALPAYRRAAALDPDEPWTWIAIAWMGQAKGAPASEVEAAIARARRAAAAAGDAEAAIAALVAEGQLRTAQGQAADAVRALREAVRLGERQAAARPGALADLALLLNLLGDLQLQTGATAEAAGPYGRAFELRRRLAAAAPDEPSAQLDLAASHARLALLAAQSGRPDDARRHHDAAFALYHAVASRDRFTPTLDAASPGAAAHVFLLAGLLTLAGGVLLLARYRRAVNRWMMAAAGTPPAPAAAAARAPAAEADAAGALAVRFVDVSQPRRRLAELLPAQAARAPRSLPMAGAGRALRRAALLQVLAGAVFATLATALTFAFGDIDFAPLRAALIFWSWAWAIVVVLGLLWGGDPTRTALVLGVYLGGLLLICTVVALGDTPPLDLFGITVPPFFQPLIFWANAVSYSLFLLVFLNRSVRSVGPVLLVFAVIACAGGLLAQVALSTYAATRAMAAVSATLGLPVALVLPLTGLLGMILLALPAWWVIGRIRRAYQAKRISEQMLMFDSIWLFQALILCLDLILAAGLIGWLGLAAFAAYKLTAVLGARPLARAAAARPAAKLLLLRVFGFRRRMQRLFDVLEARWRYAGPIQMIGAPDLAGRTIDPGEIMDFLSGRLRRRFIIEPGDLRLRLAEIDVRPDPDGRFRVNDIFCGKDTWQAAVTSLMASADLVAMDLRGFAKDNQGCVFELQALLDSVPAGRIVLVADRSTDLDFLRRTLARCAQAMAPTSPNRASPAPLTVLNAGTRDRRTVRALLTLADAALIAAAAASAPAAPRPGVQAA